MEREKEELNSHNFPVTRFDVRTLHSWPFEYDPTPLEQNEGHFIPRKGRGRKEMLIDKQETAEELQKKVDTLSKQIYEQKEEKRKFKSGATSTKGAMYQLIPSEGLRIAAERFELGLIKHPDGCYNNMTNQAPLQDNDWLVERLSHCIQHSMNLIKLIRDGKIKEGAGDAGAISFCGLVLGEAVHVAAVK